MMRMMQFCCQRFFLVLGIVLVMGLFFPVVTYADGVQEFADGLMGKYVSRIEAIEGTVRNAAMSLFGLLFTCQFVWSVIQLLLSESFSFGAVFINVARQIFTGLFFYWFLFDRTVLRTILDSFVELAGSVLTPGQMLFLIAESSGRILTAVGNSNAGMFQGIGLWLMGVGACLVMGFAVTMAISYLFFTLLENYIAGSLGVILLGFGGSDYTRHYALSYIKALVAIGFKYFLTALIVHTGVTEFAKELIHVTSVTDAASLMEICQSVIMESFLFFSIVRIIPNLSETLINGVSMSTQGAVGNVYGGVVTPLRLARAPVGMAASVGISSVKYAANAYMEHRRRRREREETEGGGNGMSPP